jgi:uncharacterized protein (UPF0248 family)
LATSDASTTTEESNQTVGVNFILLPLLAYVKKGDKIMNLDKIREQFVETIDKYSIGFNDRGIDANINAWKDKKASLIEMLRNHPFWDEEEMAIVYSVKQVRKVTHETVNECLSELDNMMYYANVPQRRLINECIGYITKYLTQKFSGDPAFVESMVGMKFNNDQACSKIMRKILVKYGVDQIKDVVDGSGNVIRKGFEKVYAQLADSLSPITITNTAVLSVHPCDYLTMSHGNSWDSCHSIANRGCHANGTLSYMNDPVTMIFYTVNGKTDRDYHTVPKHTRQTFYFDNGALIQSRLYPDTDNDEQRTLYRHIVQSTISLCLEEPNLWKVRKCQEDVNEWCDTYENAPHYADYNYEEYSSTLSLLSSASDRIIIGSVPFCLECGTPNRSSRHTHCSDGCPPQQESEDESCVECRECDSYIDMGDENSYHEINGRIYCNGCVQRCDDCMSYVFETYTAYNSHGDSIEICERCRCDYSYCEVCDHLINRDDMRRVGDEYYCDECFDGRIYECASCGEYHKSEDSRYDDDNRRLCVYCYDELSDAVSELVGMAVSA